MAEKYSFTGYNGLETIFETTAEMTHGRMLETLRTLAARHLTEQEIVDAMSGKNELLAVRPDEQGGTYSSGENPHYTARWAG